MLRFLLRRLAVLIPTFIGVSIIAFSFIRMLPGDPVALMSGERVMSPERHAEISRQLGYDRPIVVMTGIMALRRAWMPTTRNGDRPFARAVRT